MSSSSDRDTHAKKKEEEKHEKDRETSIENINDGIIASLRYQLYELHEFRYLKIVELIS